FSEIEASCRRAAGKNLESVKLFDVFRDEKIGVGKKSYAISLTLRDDQKTMTDNDTEQLMNRVIKNLEEQTQATIRK
ncbi:MAG TPA: hypothetical protein DCQ93_08540, partial [Bacteroidetes bacterium]|nr:hypothetical protein [Bacteroidota bacterium]